MPVNPNANTSILEVIIHQKHTWILNDFQCNQSLIDSLGWYTNGGGAFNGQPSLQCQSPTPSYLGAGFTVISQRTYCTDLSTVAQISTGALITRINISRSTNMTIGYVGAAWPNSMRMASGLPANNWSVVTRINLTQSFVMNSSPGKVLMHCIIKCILFHSTVIASVPIICVIEGQTTMITFPIADCDTGNVIRCRWASSVGAAGDECGDVCNNLPGANFSE